MSTATEHREIEFKFRIPEDAAIDLPAAILATGMNAQSQSVRHMTATYYDTPNLSLIRWGITLRNRQGGGDDGWHMKIPAGPADSSPARDEIRIESTAPGIPRELVSIAAPLIRRQEIVPMAIVRTDRQPIELSDESGAPLIEIVDDYVTVSTADGPEPISEFHEVEVELLLDSPRSRAIAEQLSKELQAQGAISSSVSKAAQALGRLAADPPDVPQLDFPPPSAPAIESLRAIFSTYVRDLLMADVGVRRGVPDSVHQMRVASRRLRSSLRTFAPLLDGETTAFLREELAWLASELGEVRDTEVQRARLCALTDNESLRSYIREFLDQQLRAATSGALAALRSDRHDFLVEDLILLVSEPPVGPAAFEPGDSVFAECLRAPWRRLRRAVQRAQRSATGEEWHRVRIRAKQARYAFESLAPVLGKRYQKVARKLAQATDLLGQRQDAQVSAHVLREIARSAPGDVAYQLGLLAAHNEVTGKEDIRSFVKTWPTIVEAANSLGLD